MRVQGVQGQGCPQHESTQPGPLTLLPRKTRVRHKKQAQVQSQQNEFQKGLTGVQRVGGSRERSSTQQIQVHKPNFLCMGPPREAGFWGTRAKNEGGCWGVQGSRVSRGGPGNFRQTP